MHKSACNFREMAELDFANCPFLLGNPLWLDLLLRNPHPYVIRHGFGYSVFEHSENGIISELWVYVAMAGPGTRDRPAGCIAC